MDLRKKPWLSQVLRLQGSVVPAVLPRAIFCAVFAIFISFLDAKDIKFNFPTADNLIPSIVLGLLLVFRTNTAYDRYWEGRKSWGILIINVRNLARQIWVAIEENKPEDREQKIAVLRLLVAFAIATKLYLRSEPINEEIKELIAPERYEKLQTMNHPPLEIAFWISDYLQDQYKRGCLNIHQLTAMQELLDNLSAGLAACERILRTPIPLAYAIHLRQLLLIYCLALPFQLVKTLTWKTGLAVGLISFALLGIEEIGVEIENPFGHDPNDLPLDTICANMKRNIEDLISLAPSVGTEDKL